MDRSILPPPPRYDETLPTVYTGDEISGILGAADPYMHLVIGLALKCGLREQEIVYLEWADIHRQDKVLRVSSKPGYVFPGEGLGRKGYSSPRRFAGRTEKTGRGFPPGEKGAHRRNQA